jgi:hypothetical protein
MLRSGGADHDFPRRFVVRRQAMKSRVLVEQGEERVFVAQVPSLPGCISQGKTREEVIRNAKEAIAC